jgi:multimeric flavodoxin WrbA
MKILAINGSPKMKTGNTALILDPFLDGAREAGGEVEVFCTKTLNINPCQEEFHCWLKTPGRCFQEDDMQMLHPKFREADVWVLATPVFAWGMPGPVKNLVDRLIPLIEPAIELRYGHCTHPIRTDVKTRSLVLVSSCGFWEMDNFDPLLAQVEMFCRVLGLHFAGALLRPHAHVLGPMLQAGMPVNDVLQAAKQAGRQLVKNGTVSAEVLKAVSRELMAREVFLRVASAQFEEAMEALEPACA